jgi:hypothetical protein
MTDTIKFYEDPQASGTQHYYRLSHFAPLVSTDGVQMMFHKLQCFWIADIVASYLPKLSKLDCFFSIKIIVSDSKAIFTADDGNGNILITQHIEYTDLAENVHMFLESGECGGSPVWVLLLPSEH